MKKINYSVLALLLLGIAMIVLGIKAGIIPPTLTGIGFLVIAYELNKKK